MITRERDIAGRAATGWMNPWRRASGVAALAVAGILCLWGPLAGCASSSGTGRSERPTYIDDYTSGNFATAYAGASAASRNTSLPEATRERATLIAGEAAHAMDRDTEAETWLFKVSGSQDPLVRGKAQATLGLIALDKGNMPRAAELLDDASGSLMGDEAARASMYAGDAFRAQGNETQAMNSYRKASGLARNDGELKTDIAERLSGKSTSTMAAAAKSGSGAASKGPFTLQLAAFSSPQKAQQHAGKVRTQASRLALGHPLVVPVYRNGKILYSVRLGRFAARTDAERVKGQFQGAMVISASA